MKKILVMLLCIHSVIIGAISDAGTFFNTAYQDAVEGKYGNDLESVSGPGSTCAQTEAIRLELPILIPHFNITTILDAPCGDFNWMRYVDLTNYTYTGIDVIHPLILKNNTLYNSENRSFLCKDLLIDSLPYADLIISRDFLVHLSDADIWKALENFKQSGAKYLLTTTFLHRTNYNINSGGWRPLCLTQPPFNFPEPLLFILEKCTEQDGLYADKSLALWKLEDLQIS
jgi:hypothetical protein